MKYQISLFVPLLTLGLLAGCARTPQSPEIAGNIRRSLDHAGFKNVSVTQDREQGVVTLAGHVASDNEKGQVDGIARSIAAGQVVADEIAILPAGMEHDARAIYSDLDKGIGQNLDAALIENRMHDAIHYSVRNQVVTLTGDVNSQSIRGDVARVASSVPNVQQVVNEIQIKNQKATSPQ